MIPARTSIAFRTPSMKTQYPLLVLALILSVPLCRAEDKPPADDWKPAPTNQEGRQYPQVNSEGRVKFRIVAPKAQTVGVSFKDSSPFIRGEDGAWTGYSRPLDEAHKPSILVLLMDEAGDEPAHPAPSQRPMNDRELSSLLRRAATSPRPARRAGTRSREQQHQEQQKKS